MTGSVDTAISEQSSAGHLLEVISECILILDDERQIFLTGAYDGLAVLVERKRHVLDRLEHAIRSASRSDTITAALTRLISISRRNEEIIESALQGLAHARRRIQDIGEAGAGAVAYAADGSRISCRADRLGNEKTA